MYIEANPAPSQNHVWLSEADATGMVHGPPVWSKGTCWMEDNIESSLGLNYGYVTDELWNFLVLAATYAFFYLD